MLNTTQLECFLAVANHLNFSRAAQELHITQPAVSHQINTLEAELEVKLFHRTSKNVRLTQAGHQFGQYAREILKLTGISRARMRQWREELPQRLGLGCRNFLVLRALQPALAVLRQEMPQLMPVLRQVPSASLDNLLEEEDVQAIFTMQRESGPKLSRRHLADCPVVCVCTPDHPLAGYEQLTVEQLNAVGGRIASCPPPLYSPPFLEVFSYAMAGRRPDRILFCDSLEIACTLVESGYAFTLLPDLPGTRLPGLRYIPMPQFQPLSFGALYRTGSLTPPLKRLFTLLEGSMEPSDE